jgi:intracellular multiplication protein IcmB
MLFEMIARALASLSLALKQPLESFCDLETAHGDALVTKHGDYVTFLRIDGMRRMATREDVERIAMAMRIDMGGALESRGHAIVGYYVSDPQQAKVEIERVNMAQCRAVAREVGLELADILDERMSLWPAIMRWEGAYFVLWTRTGVLTKEERKHMKEEQAALARECPSIGDAQGFFLRSEVMAARHQGFVTRVLGSLRAHDIAAAELTAHEAVTVCREAVYRETVGSGWKASLPGDRVTPRLPEDDVKKPTKEGLLWPRLRSQIFHVDAVTRGGQRVEIGENEYGSVDMAMGPEDPRPFLELAASLGRDRVPWRAALVVEGGGKTGMMLKEIGATFLAMFPTNADLRRAFAALREAREQENHISVKLRASFATWAPAGETRTLRRRVATLGQRIEGWGNCRGTTIAGDPLEGAMSSVPGLALASTATPSLALLGDVMAMLPWQGSRSPWKEGSVLFRRPDGVIWPYDPAGGSMRPSVVDLFVAPPGSGKSVLANAINLGLCLSPAVLGAQGAKLPLIGKADVGPSAEGFVRLVQEALGPSRRHEAIYARMQLTPDYAFNIFDLQVGCEYPLPLEKAFLQNFLTLVTLPADGTKPFEGLPQMISLVIDEAYRWCTDVAGGSPKRYRRGVDPLVDETLDRHRIVLDDQDPYWRDAVTELCGKREWRLAERAQRHAVPILEDLVSASRAEQVKDLFGQLRIAVTHEQVAETFARYIQDLIRRFPILNQATRLDFGPARIIVLDLAAVAPTGSAAANRQTEMMYMLARHILGRNFFLHPDYVWQVPEAVREYHRARFHEVHEAVKRLDYDEWHRTAGSPQVRAQAELDVREGRKHNIQLGFSSQRLSDMDDALVSQSTGRFVLRAGDETEAEEIVKRFNLSEASAQVVRYGLNGPGPGGAPFLAVLIAAGGKYEQMLVNTLGSKELWALSTTPGDTGLRDRLYEAVGFSEALRRLSSVFARGSALIEIERRKGERLKRGELETGADAGVIDELAAELIDGRGIAFKLRAFEGSAGERTAVAAE